MPYAWQRKYTGSQSLTANEAEWDDVYNVYGYEFSATSLAIYDLTADRPDLAPGQEHPTVQYAYVDDFEPVRLGSSRMCEVRVRWKKGAARQLSVSPLLRPARMATESEVIMIPTFKRLDGSLILNTAGGLIYGVLRPLTLLHFKFTKSVSGVPAWLIDYVDLAVNSDTVTIDGTPYAAGKLQLQSPRATEFLYEEVNGVSVAYKDFSFDLVYNPLGWEDKVYNRGLYQKTDGKIRPCFDSDLEPTQEPYFLSASGEQLPLPLNPANVIELDGVGVNSLPFNSALPLT